MTLEAEALQMEAKTKVNQAEVSRLEGEIGRILLLSWIFVWIGFALAIVGLVLQYCCPNLNLNLYGDFVGGSVGSIWALAGILFIYSAFLGQKQQIMLQQIELGYTRLEMKATREELNGQKLEMQEQNSINRKQLFESSFFQMLSMFMNLVNAIDIRSLNDKSSVTASARDCFQTFHKRLKTEMARVSSKRSRSEITDAYYRFYDHYENDLGHYFRYLYHMVKFVHFSDIENKEFYIGIIRAQLSAYELAILVYNCISDLGYRKFRPLVNQHKLLKNLNPGLLFHEQDLELILDKTEVSQETPNLGEE